MTIREVATVDIKKTVYMDREELDDIIIQAIAKKYDIDPDFCNEITVFIDRTFGEPHVIFESSEAVVKK